MKNKDSRLLAEAYDQVHRDPNTPYFTLDGLVRALKQISKNPQPTAQDMYTTLAQAIGTNSARDFMSIVDKASKEPREINSPYFTLNGLVRALEQIIKNPEHYKSGREIARTLAQAIGENSARDFMNILNKASKSSTPSNNELKNGLKTPTKDTWGDINS